MKNTNIKINNYKSEKKITSTSKNNLNYNINNCPITEKIDGFILKRVKPSLITIDE